LTKEHIVPRSISINDRCPACEKIQGIHNQAKHSGQTKYYDLIPSLLEKKYLKTIYNCHACSGTLDGGDMDGDRMITVLDIDCVIR
jgi:hypothetical protein